jgi:hypothetical protein
MSVEMTVMCNYGDWEKKMELPELPNEEKEFEPDELYDLSHELQKHHYDTGEELGVNNRHFGHTSYSIKEGDKFIGTFRFRWGYITYLPCLKKD